MITVDFAKMDFRVDSRSGTIVSAENKKGPSIDLTWSCAEYSQNELSINVSIEQAEEIAQKLSAVVMAAKNGVFTYKD